MSSKPTVINVSELCKSYKIYDVPRNRLKQFFLPRLQRIFNRPLGQYFREFIALRNISLELKQGDVLGVIGRNGSGKSTLLQIICGTLSPTSGDVRVVGRVAALLELGSGFNPEFTGRENVFLNASILGLTQPEIENKFSDIETFADIGEFIDRPVKTYSSGMMLRLAFAVIAYVDADILIIDEALAVGDALFTQKCMRFLRKFMQYGTILFVSHDAAAVKNLCNRALWLNEGEVMAVGKPKDVCELYLREFYEQQQGKSRLNMNLSKQVANTKKNTVFKDQRLDFINASNLRNDLELTPFNPNSAAFGAGGAQISDVEFLDDDGVPLIGLVGGESVILHVRATVTEHLSLPIIGFSFKDRLGQVLFGDNTYLSYLGDELACEAGNEIYAKFAFSMPILPAADYSIDVSVASGTQDVHIQHHWVHDAVCLKSISSSAATGLIGIPMRDICLEISTST